MNEGVSEHGRGAESLRRGAGADPLVVAHRGASAEAPENTLAAFRLALEQGSPAVECDVHLSADGVPVVIHDDTLDRTTDGHGPVAALPLNALRRLDAGGWYGPRFAGERLPTLDEVLALCRGRARVFVELKPGGGAPLVDAALAALSAPHAETSAGAASDEGGAKGAEADVALISFDPHALHLVAQRRPDLPLGLLVGAHQVAQLGLAGVLQATTACGAGVLAPHHSAATPALLAAAHGAGLPVSVWTVDDPQTMRALTERGVDAITTNRPAVALLECRRNR